MKILYLGDIGPGQTCLMRMRALQRLGHEVLGINTIQPWRHATWLQRQMQRRIHRGSIIKAINASVITTGQDFRPDLVWADKQEFLQIGTLNELRKLGARLIHFTPDPYFTLSWKRTRLMDEAIQGFDVLVFCKSYERTDYESLCKHVIYMPLGYCDEVHRPMPPADQKWSCGVGFLGGWEPRRESLLRAVAAIDIDLKVWGGYWDFLKDGRWTLRRRIILKQLAGGEPFSIHRDAALASTLQGGEVYGEDYANALSGAKIGLGFLRKVCPDQHTTRTFEIPACRSMLLADRTDEHQEFFEEGKEAEFFSSEDELVDKTRFYNTHTAARDKLAINGYDRSIKSGYAYWERLRNVIAALG
ncbi:MAG TPA: glycosyltransferase [Nitrospira sp.]|nr:glycosyltransferase [Nitrospira sp.]